VDGSESEAGPRALTGKGAMDICCSSHTSGRKSRIVLGVLIVLSRMDLSRRSLIPAEGRQRRLLPGKGLREGKKRTSWWKWRDRKVFRND